MSKKQKRAIKRLKRRIQEMEDQRVWTPLPGNTVEGADWTPGTLWRDQVEQYSAYSEYEDDWGDWRHGYL